MKIGFIMKMGSDSKAIVSMYNGENATFCNKDFQYKFFKGDIIFFNLIKKKPENRAINVKNVKDCTEELINNKSKFSEGEWHLVIKGNRDIFLDFVHKNNTKVFLSLKRKVYDFTPIISQLINSYKITITEWHHYKAGDDSCGGVVMHSHFNIDINSNLDYLILNLVKDWDEHFQPIKIYLNSYVSDNTSTDSFKKNNVHIGRIHFISDYLKSLFPAIGKTLYHDSSYRYLNNEYYKSDLKNWSKIHNDAENLENEMQIKLKAEYSPIALFKELTVKLRYKFPHNEEYNIIHCEEILNELIAEWDYIKIFENKKYCYTKKLNFRYT